jgi:hypothetical protein
VFSLRVLARVAAREQPHRAFCFYQALEALGQLDDEGQAFLASHSPVALEADSFYAGELTEEDRPSLLDPREPGGLHEVFALIWEAAPALITKTLADYGVGPGERVSPIADTDLAKVFAACARALGVKQTTLYVAPEGLPRGGVQIVGIAPPAIIVDRQIASDRSVTELRFLVGRALELSHPSAILAPGLERAEFSRLLASVLRAFHPRHMRGRGDLGAAAVEQAQSLRRIMPFKVARRLNEIFRERPNVPFDSAEWRQAVQRSANRAGLALCGDLSVALRLIIEEDPTLAASPLEDLLRTSPTIRDLFGFAVSDAFYACQVKLGMAGSAAPR